MTSSKKRRRKASEPQPAGQPRVAAEDDAPGAAQAEPAQEAPEEIVEQWRDRALRAQAEMANMRKRVDNEVEERTRMRMESLFSELITLHDHLELALESVPDSVQSDSAARSFVDGVGAIHAALDLLMQRYGLEPIHPEGYHDFDPAHHEAVHTEEREELKEPQLDLLRRGYRMGRRILRPAQVRLLQPPADSADGEDGGEPAAPDEEDA